MLRRVSLDSLKKVAFYGAVLSATGCSVLYYLIQRKYTNVCFTMGWVVIFCNDFFSLFLGKFATSPYYKKSVEVLRQNQLACKLLGQPLRFQTLRLGDEQNWVTTEEAHVC